MRDKPTLTGERVVLRAPLAADVAARFALGNSPEIEAMFGGNPAQTRPITDAAAQAWVDKEIDALIGVIEDKGVKQAGGSDKSQITFGELFDIYADISDSLVGILLRAKKRKRLAFEAGMLFQGVHDDVEIKVL